MSFANPSGSSSSSPFNRTSTSKSIRSNSWATCVAATYTYVSKRCTSSHSATCDMGASILEMLDTLPSERRECLEAVLCERFRVESPELKRREYKTMERWSVVHRAAVAIAGARKYGGSSVGRVASNTERLKESWSMLPDCSVSTTRSSTDGVLRAGSRGGAS